MFNLIIKPFAELDATEAAKWYNLRKEGLGDEFLLVLDAKLNAIKRDPKQFTKLYKNIHRALTERFPFGIFYIIEKEAIYVLAIVHTHRNPQYWKKRRN